jgi:hypothetical protein
MRVQYSVEPQVTYTGRTRDRRMFTPGFLLDPAHSVVQSARAAVRRELGTEHHHRAHRRVVGDHADPASRIRHAGMDGHVDEDGRTDDGLEQQDQQRAGQDFASQATRRGQAEQVDETDGIDRKANEGLPVLAVGTLLEALLDLPDRVLHPGHLLRLPT